MHGRGNISNRKLSKSAILSKKYLFTIAVFLSYLLWIRLCVGGGGQMQSFKEFKWEMLMKEKNCVSSSVMWLLNSLWNTNSNLDPCTLTADEEMSLFPSLNSFPKEALILQIIMCPLVFSLFGGMNFFFLLPSKWHH
jgi:hypothetical protein